MNLLNGKTKRVCVIGCGSSGLVVMKELRNVGIEVKGFELLPHVGGVYIKSYKNTILTTSSLLTAWSDHSDGKELSPKFWTAEEYLHYLQNFAIKHDLLKDIEFSCGVQSIRKCQKTGKWLVTVLKGRPCSGIHRCPEVEEDKSAEPEELVFDAVAVCSGTNTFASHAHFSGQEKFKGKIMHSEEYVSPEPFIGKRVLIVGTGESGSDIANEVSKVADKVAIVIRGKHGHILPRIQCNGSVTDTNTNRVRYSNPYVFGPWIGYMNSLSKYFLAFLQPDSDQKRVMLKIGELNMKQGTSAFTKFGCKNEGFVSAMVLRGAELYRTGFALEKDHAVFTDGQQFPCDIVLACTGYRNAFPYFEDNHPELVAAGKCPRGNYKQIFSIDYPNEIGFFGFARPAFGSIPPTTEMQARLWALVLSGHILLPSAEVMIATSDKDRAEWERRFVYDSERVKGLVDYQIYCDSLAEIMGVMPPLWELFWTKPRLWLQIMCGPFTVHQYRLRGPYATPTHAEDILMRHPLGDTLETCITAFFLLLAKFLSLLGLRMFKPNNF